MSEHTPGPWTVSDYYEEESPPSVIGSDGYPVADAQGTSIKEGYAEKFGVGHWALHEGTAYIERERSEWEADARLIAAAPDMLAALEMLMGHIDDGDAIHKEWLYGAEQAIARAAIAKARKASEGER